MRVIVQTVTDGQPVVNQPADWTDATLRAAIAALRYEREVAGITVSGIPISTERGDHRIVMAQIRAEARANVGFSVDLKTADGFVSLNAVQVLAVTDAMLWYVTACFAKEAALLNALDTGTSVAEVAASMETGWPEGVF